MSNGAVTSMPPTQILPIYTPTIIPATPTKTASPTITTPAVTLTAPPTLVIIPTITAALPTSATNIPTGQNNLNAYITTGKDDAEENSQGKVTLSGDDLELVYDTSNQIIGLRYVGVNIPKGATIVNASIQFKADEVHTKATRLNIQGEINPNAPAFAATTRNISSRLRTQSLIVWSPFAWSKSGAVGSDQLTPNLAPIIQEIIDQSGWVPGNSIVLIITGTGKRVATSFEGPGAPYLLIEFNDSASLLSSNAVTTTMTSTIEPTTTQTVTAPPPLPTVTKLATSTQTVAPTETLLAEPSPTPTVIITETEPALPTDISVPTPTQ